MMKLPTLQDVLSYQHPYVLKLYQQNYPQHTMSAESAFREMLKYLWLTQQHASDQVNAIADIPPRCVMLRSMQAIDDMWHEFILFTKDYCKFCDDFFGEYIHHMPNLFDTMPRPRDEIIAEVGQLLPYVAKHLGDETLQTWYASYLDA